MGAILQEFDLYSMSEISISDMFHRDDTLRPPTFEILFQMKSIDIDGSYSIRNCI
jgi:hypothetical protein